MSGWLGTGVPRICVSHLKSCEFIFCATDTCSDEAEHTSCSCDTFESCSSTTVVGGQGERELCQRACMVR